MFKNFVRDSIGFSLANIAIKALNIILIPIYVRYLSFEEYGIFELVTTLVIIFVIQAINYSIVVIFRSQKKFLFAIRHSIIVAFVSGFFALTFLIYSG